MDAKSDRISMNTLHAAATWLKRLEFSADSVACVVIAPRAALGVWSPGRGSVEILPVIDDAGAELVEAAAPVVEHVLRELAIVERSGVFEAIQQGARLQLLVSPTAGEIALRLVGHGGAILVGGSVAISTPPS